MTDRVLHQVTDHAFEQGPLAPDRGRLQLQIQTEPHGLGLARDSLHLAVDDAGQVEVDHGRRGVRVRQHQQAVDELLAPVHSVGDRRSHLLQLLRGGVRVGQSHVYLGADDGERGAEFV